MELVGKVYGMDGILAARAEADLWCVCVRVLLLLLLLLAGSGKDPEWFLEVDAGDIDQRADASLNYVSDPAQKRLTFAAGGGLWSLKFPSAETYRAFMTELEVRSTRLRGWRVKCLGKIW